MKFILCILSFESFEFFCIYLVSFCQPLFQYVKYNNSSIENAVEMKYCSIKEISYENW